MDRLDRRCAQGRKRRVCHAVQGPGAAPSRPGHGAAGRGRGPLRATASCRAAGRRGRRPGLVRTFPTPIRAFASRLLRPRALQCPAMLKRLTLRDFAVVPESELEFGPGMTVISGETGAGKSLLVDALGFLSGLRAD